MFGQRHETSQTHGRSNSFWLMSDDDAQCAQTAQVYSRPAFPERTHVVESKAVISGWPNRGRTGSWPHFDSDVVTRAARILLLLPAKVLGTLREGHRCSVEAKTKRDRGYLQPLPPEVEVRTLEYSLLFNAGQFKPYRQAPWKVSPTGTRHALEAVTTGKHARSPLLSRLYHDGVDVFDAAVVTFLS